MRQQNSNKIGRVALPAALSTLSFGCAPEPADDFDDPTLRASEVEIIFSNDTCVVERGDLWKPYGGKILVDAILRCPDSRIRTPEVAIDDDGLWGQLDASSKDVQFFIEHNKATFTFDWLDELPGDGFTGQAPDGTLYRVEDHLAGYLYNDGLDWIEVPVEGLPDLFWSNNGFAVHPDSTGQLHAQFETNGFGEYLFWLASLDNGAWSWAETGDSLYGTSSIRYAGPDAWDRLITIRSKLANGVPRWHLGVDGDNDLLIGAPADYNGVLAAPPRPKVGGEPLAMLQRADASSLALITAVDGDDWTQSPIAGTAGVPEMCDPLFATDQPVCPPCHYEAKGIERDAFHIVRTSSGPIWGLWIVSDIEADYVYDIVQIKVDRWRCELDPESSSSSADATLVVSELGVDGSTDHELELDIGSVWVSDRTQRNMAAAAFNNDIGVIIQADSDEGETVARVLRIDTAKID